METRKDLNISTWGFVDGVEEEGLDVEAFIEVEPPERGGSRSSGLGVGAALVRIGREESGAGVARGSRFLSDMEVVSEFHVLFWLQLEFVS